MTFIAPGEFFRGCDERIDHTCVYPEKPGGRASTDGFWIDVTEVSARSYRECVRAGRCSQPPSGNACVWGRPTHLDHPINCVTYHQAEDYCRHLGMRLPSSLEWEVAARGHEDHRIFPWGNRLDARPVRVNLADAASQRDFPGWTWARRTYRDGYALTAPVESFRAGASPEGVLNLAGNVAEWTSEGVQDPGPTGVVLLRVVRGGSYMSSLEEVRISAKTMMDPSLASGLVGFRCVGSVDDEHRAMGSRRSP